MTGGLLVIDFLGAKTARDLRLSGTMVPRNAGGPGAVGAAPDRGQHLCGGAVMADAICSVDDCQTAVLARGWCGKHYRRWQTTGDPTAVVAKASPEARFWRKVNKTDSCWLWTAGTGGALGYGRFREGGRKHQAHRWAYESLVGPIPDGLHLDHLCRVPACVNPAHLEPVTNRENFLRSNAPAAIVLRTGACMRGHEWSDENTYVTPAGQRICRPCRRITHALRKGRA